ncbi:probable flavonol reductase/cinnamoyl-CoA reductase [Phialocephala subalpina]|uniref:Probable flavonol reductase/cinnamoyl-CoA reductase n=1 Tax=Phialocephala subalpina TaxID=576137 RepID=A0A1L7XFH7_9HELO|nr:probable flavonol reductase/cinnamoyl-CoA reductase [Phialocephala subalpina]
MEVSYVLVTGATGFIGAHVVDELLRRGLKVRGATRSMLKGKAMLEARPNFASKLDFVQIEDFEKMGVFDEAVKGVDAVIHVASPFTYNTTNNEKELIIPAINGVRSILQAAAKTPSVKRIALTSSFAAVLDVNRKAPPYFTYTAKDWNPLTYEEAISPITNAVVAYRGSKKFAELAAWSFIEDEKPSFDIVTLCPPMTFGPVVHPMPKVEDLNESNAMLWSIAKGEKLPVARVPFWIDVRDLAMVHVEALVRKEVGNRRFVPASPERFSYSMAAEIMRNEFEWARERVRVEEEQKADDSHGLDGEEVTRELGVRYRSFRETVVDLVAQAWELSKKTDES